MKNTVRIERTARTQNLASFLREGFGLIVRDGSVGRKHQMLISSGSAGTVSLTINYVKETVHISSHDYGGAELNTMQGLLDMLRDWKVIESAKPLLAAIYAPHRARRVAFICATLEELLTAAKGEGFDELKTAAGKAYWDGINYNCLEGKQVNAIEKELRARGFRSIDVTDPNWVVPTELEANA